MSTDSVQPAWRSAALLLVLYLCMGAVSRVLADGPTQTMPIWLGAAILFAAFMRRHNSVALFLAGWLAAAIWGAAAHDLRLLPCLVFGLIEAGSAWLGARVATLRVAPPLSLRTVVWLLAGALLTALLGATLATQFWSESRPDINRLLEWRTWALSTLVGIVLVVPVALAYQGFQARRSGGMPRRQFGLGLIAFAIFTALALWVFSPQLERMGTTATTLAYLPMPFLLASSMLWGARGGSLAMLAGGLLIMARSASGAGPFAVLDAFDGEAVLEAQAFVILWAVLILFGRGLEDGRRRAMEIAQEWRLRYERTMQATATVSVEFDAVNGAATWSPDAARLLGGGITQVQSMNDWLEHVDSASRPLAAAAWQQARSGQPVQADSYEIAMPGRKLTVQTALAPVFGPDGTVEEVAALVHVQSRTAHV